jgi:hypothetical protein
MRLAGIVCDRGVVLICDGGLKRTPANVQRLFVQLISGDCSGQKKDSCFDFSDGLVKSKAIPTRNSVLEHHSHDDRCYLHAEPNWVFLLLFDNCQIKNKSRVRYHENHERMDQVESR